MEELTDRILRPSRDNADETFYPIENIHETLLLPCPHAGNMRRNMLPYYRCAIKPHLGVHVHRGDTV